MDFGGILLHLEARSMATVLIAGLLVYWVGSAIFLAVLHPLAKFPGPKLAAASDWWLVYHEWFLGKSLTDILFDLHQNYDGGLQDLWLDMDRIAYVVQSLTWESALEANSLVKLHFSSMQAYSDIYNVKSKWDKDPEVYKAIVDTSSAFGLRNYHEAKERRDLIWPFYSRQSVQRMQKAINRQISFLVDQLDKQNQEGKLSNMSMAFRCLAQDIMADICLGKSFGTLEERDFGSPLIHALDEGLESYVLMKSFPTLRNILYSISAMVTLPGEAEFATYGTIVADHVTRGIQQPHTIPPNTMLGFLVPTSSNTAKEAPQPKLSQGHMTEELQTFVIGAGETVASAMVQGLSGILQSPDLYKNVYEEIVQVWPETDGPVPPIEVLEKLPLLTAVIKEALRLTHGVVTPLARVVSAGGACIDGHHVPGGTSVGTSHVFIHMSSDYYDAPDEFRPERWLGSSSDKHLVAFSKGPRGCMGINLAWCQLYLVLATLVRTVQMEYPADLNDIKIKWKDCFQPLYYGRPLQVRCTRAEGHS
ncbi:hypothetical protein AFCA_009182 [Aspergillus flavus]|uniref:Cytochrome P450 n=1 Tax=Aspergillus flavus TaxID=5059 RepID=A0AB74CDD6_ASPFL|nr:cytochrome P450 [Aspergillus flavus]RAQ78520.1 cytochrome P450 [Aspergillus flavus]RMZ43366.1 cytochrome P450 [Aspergillus flavus]UDD61841.1 hypothetical protein AFCA_009182 [Aspergillus flavus]